MGLTHQGIANHDVAGLGTATQEVAIDPLKLTTAITLALEPGAILPIGVGFESG